MQWLKPSFSNHFGNYILAAMVGLFFFFSASLVFAATGDEYTPGKYWQVSGFKNNTPLSACTDYYMATWGMGAHGSWNYYQSSTSFKCYRADGAQLVTVGQATCTSPGDDGQSYCEAPAPPPPADCQEHADQNNGQGDYIVTDNFPTVGCDKGCLFEVDTSGKSSDPESPDFGRWISIITWTGLDCPFNGGYDDTKVLGVETKDVYPLDTDFQNCYRPDGTFLGRVGVDMTCPTFVNCWNDDRTHIDAVAPDPGSCPTGTQSDTERDWAAAEKNQTTTTTTNPDGSTDTTTTQQTEQTAPDGSKSTTTYTKTTSCDAQGQNCTTTETTSDSGATCEGDDCDADQMTAENYDNCAVDLVCTGDVHQCAMLELQRTEVCRFEEITKGSAITEALQKADDDGELASVDGNGLLADGPQAVVNIDSVIDVNTMLADNGRSGSCPSPHDMSFFGSTIQFKYDSVCDAVEGIRPLVLLAASFLCLMMVGRAVLGTGKE